MENSIIAPHDFKVACAVYYFRPKDILQNFINYVSFYTSVSSEHNPGFKEATNTLAEYSFIIRPDEPTLIIDRNREYALKCVREVLALTFKKGWNEEKKRLKSLPIVKRFLKAIDSGFTPEKIYLDEESVLHLTDDFRLRCEMFQQTPKVFLEYFMSRISLADRDAKATLKIGDDNPAMNFFELTRLGLGDFDGQNMEVTDTDEEFRTRIQQMHYEVFLIRDFDKRRALFAEIYTNYYNQLTKNRKSWN